MFDEFKDKDFVRVLFFLLLLTMCFRLVAEESKSAPPASSYDKAVNRHLLSEYGNYATIDEF